MAASPLAIDRIARHAGPARAERCRVEPAWLAERLGGETLRIVDTRGKDAFARNHVPGSIELDARRLFVSPGELVSPFELALVMSSAGIGDGHTVVFVDDGPGALASDTVRALAAYGHDDVHVLAGGYTRWIAERRPVTTEVVRHAKASFTAKFHKVTT